MANNIARTGKSKTKNIDTRKDEIDHRSSDLPTEGTRSRRESLSAQLF